MKRIVSLLALVLTIAVLASLTMVQTAAVVPSLTINFNSASDLTKYFSRPSGTTDTWKVSGGKLINDSTVQSLAGHEAEDWFWGNSFLTLKNQQLKDFEIEIAVLFKETIDADALVDANFWSLVTNVANAGTPAGVANPGYEWLNFQGTVYGPGVKQFQLWDQSHLANDYSYEITPESTAARFGVTKKVSDWETGGVKTFKIVKSGTTFSFFYKGVQQNWNAGYTDYNTPTGGTATVTNDVLDRAGYVQLKIGYSGYFEIESIKITSPELNLDAYNTPTPAPTSANGQATPTGSGNPSTGDAGTVALFGIALLSTVTLAVGRRIRK